MDILKEKKRTETQKNPSFFSRITFSYLNDVFKNGNQQSLSFQDVLQLNDNERSKFLSEKLERIFKKFVAKQKNRNIEGGRNSLFKSLCVLAFPLIAPYGLLLLLMCAMKLLQPILLRKIIEFLTSNDVKTSSEGFVWGSCLSLLLLIISQVQSHITVNMETSGTSLKSATLTLIFKRALQLNTGQMECISTGHLITLFSTDGHKIQESLKLAHYIWAGPLLLLIATIILWQELGPTCLAGVSILLITVPLQSLFGKLFANIRLESLKATDERVCKMKEIFTSIDLIKMNTMEESFANTVKTTRKTETTLILKSCFLRAFNLAMFGSSAYIVMFATFVTVYFRDAGNISMATMFETMSMFFVIRVEVVLLLPIAVQMLIEGYIASKRVQEFLLCEETDTDDNFIVDNNGNFEEKIVTAKKEDDGEHKETKPKVLFESVTASRSEFSKSVVKDISFLGDDKNNLVMVVGPVGSGKSSLLLAALNEIFVKYGNIEVHGKTAYSAQQPWIFTGTVRQNILFGKEFNEDWYKQVIAACALETDLKQFSAGDLTNVGENGSSLSGGQKARISLARAVYQDADIYFLDDPLSAVDSNVSSMIFERCIKKVLKNKIVLLATHQVQYLTNATQVIRLENWKTAARGKLSNRKRKNATVFLDVPRNSFDHEVFNNTDETYNDNDGNMTVNDVTKTDDNNNRKLLLTKQTRSRKFSHHFRKHSMSQQPVSNKENRSLSLYPVSNRLNHQAARSCSLLPNMDSRDKSSLRYLELSKSFAPIPFDSFMDRRKSTLLSVISNLSIVSEPEDILEEECLAVGAVPFEVYHQYFLKITGCLRIILLLIVLCSGQTVLTLTDYYMVQWAKGEEARSNNGTFTSPFLFHDKPDMNLCIFASLVVFGFALNIFRSMLLFSTMIRCSRHLHNKVLRAVLYSPLSFFHSVPIGQLLNRFSRDVYFVDDELPWKFYDAIQFLLLTIAILIVNIISIPFLMVLVIPCVVFFLWFRWYYMKTACQVRRIEAKTRSPLYTHLSSTLSGLPTIRALNKEEIILKEFYVCQDHQAQGWLMFIQCARWFTYRLDLIATAFAICAIFAPIIAVKYTDVDAGRVSISLTYTLTLTGMFQWCIRQTAEVGNLMTSVQRLFEYTKLTLEESDQSNQSISVAEDWPQDGSIVIENGSFSYNIAEPTILTNLNICIRSKEKIGIVGRTGAGKSSMLNMIMRMGHIQGTITIDGQNIENTKLKQLRESISVIPQNPIMFDGTLRSNIDPSSKYGDDEIWDALDEVQMKETVSNLRLKLEESVSGSSGNFSVGERQLLSLASSILRRNKILVVDEATANVDFETESVIQKTIRETFKSCTVLTVAHRLRTIIDSDRIMVLEGGEVIEFDTPYMLLQKTNGIFKKLFEKQTTEENKETTNKQSRLKRQYSREIINNGFHTNL